MSAKDIEAQLRSMAAQAAGQGASEAAQRMFSQLLRVAELETGTRLPNTYAISGTTEDARRNSLEGLLKGHMVRDKASFESDPYVRFLFTDPNSEETVTTSFTPDTWHVEGGKYFFNATYDNEQALDIEAELTKPGENGAIVRHPLLPRYSTLMKLSVDYFEGLGSNVQAIRGSWATEYGGQPNTNWLVYTQALKVGHTQESAALLTPTGKAVSRLGFRHPFFVPIRPEVHHEEKIKGVDLVFYKSPK